ncbi:MAG: glycosyltransferase family 4 protein [Candidatus Methanomethylicia archaeon]
MNGDSERINVLVVTHHFPPEVNGTATRIYEIIRGLQKMYPNVRFFVVTPPPNRPFGKFPVTFKFLHKISFRDNRITVFRIWSYQPKSSNPDFLKRAFNYLLFPILSLPIIIGLSFVSKMAIIITPPSPIHFTTLFLKMLGKKIVVDVTDLWHEEAEHLGYSKHSLFLILSRGLELLSLKISNLVTVASYTLAKFVKNMINSKKSIIVLPTPLDRPIMGRYNRDNKLFKDELIIYAGNFGKPQALHLAVKAFAILNSEGLGNRIKLLLIGGGEEEEHLRYIIQQLNINNVVILHPVSRDELFNKFLNKATVGLVPLSFNKALIYALPTKVLEYLACSLPYLSYGSSLELKRFALMFKAGLHVDVEDEREIAEAIKYIIKHKESFSINTQKAFNVLMSSSYDSLREIIKLIEKETK